MSMLWRHQAGIVMVGAVLLLTNLGRPALWDRDEPRNAGCAREMLERGDWVVPTFNGELRAHKPVLLYWLIMSAYQVLGVNEWAARCGSALLSIGTLLATYHVGRLLYRPEVGLWGALLLGTSLFFDVAGRAATPDASLLFCSTLVLLLFAANLVRSGVAGPTSNGDHASTGNTTAGEQLSWPLLAAMYAAMGLGVLAKGPVAIVLPTGAMLVYLLWRRRPNVERPAGTSKWGWLRAALDCLAPRHILSAIRTLRPLTGMVVVALVALPWYLLVTLRTDGVFLEEFLGTHNLARFTGSMEHHRGPLGYYVVAILIGMLPGSVLAAPTVIGVVRRIRARHPWSSSDKLLVCWALVIVVFFSLAATKLPSYVLPAYPALALLAGALVWRWLSEPQPSDRRWFHAAMAALALVGIALGVGLPIAARYVLPGEELLGLMGVIPLGTALAALVLYECGRRRAALAAFAAGAALLATALFGFASLRVDRHRNARNLMALVEATSGGAPHRVSAYAHFRSTYPFYARQRVDEFDRPEQVAKYFRNPQTAYLVAPEERLPELNAVLPRDVEVLARRPKFLKEGNLVLLGRRPGVPQATARRPAAHSSTAKH